MSQEKEQRCEGRFCHAREKCGRHADTGQPERWLPVDYSMAPQFKPENSIETCEKFTPINKISI